MRQIVPTGPALEAPIARKPVRRPKLVAGVLLNRRNRRLIEKATRCIGRATKIPGTIRTALGRQALDRFEKLHQVDIAFDGRVTRQTPLAAANPS
jgi:hypothetical protein